MLWLRQGSKRFLLSLDTGRQLSICFRLLVCSVEYEAPVLQISNIILPHSHSLMEFDVCPLWFLLSTLPVRFLLTGHNEAVMTS